MEPLLPLLPPLPPRYSDALAMRDTRPVHLIGYLTIVIGRVTVIANRYQYLVVVIGFTRPISRT